MPETTLSSDAQKVLDLIGKEESKLIQKSNPNLTARNKAIYTLGRKGIKGNLLAEITGLSTSSLSRILDTKNNNNCRFFNRREMELSRLKWELDSLLKRYRFFIMSRKERR
jgi:hypothetical protein